MSWHRWSAPVARALMSHFGIAGLQLELDGHDNLGRIEAEILNLRRRFPWIQMAVLGELCAFGASVAHAQSLPGNAEDLLRSLARSQELWLVPGTLYESSEGNIFNTSPVIDPGGAVVARSRKLFPFLPYEQNVCSGSEFVVFDVPGIGRFGVSICYDMWFPETTRSLVSLGAEVILHPSMTSTIDRDVELSIARASAAINQCYFFDIAVAGAFGNGRSIVCGPGGEVIYCASDGRDVIVVDVDLDYVRRTRERGWHGLGQTLKSFRDSKLVYPAYGAGAAHSPTLAKLGPLATPTKD